MTGTPPSFILLLLSPVDASAGSMAADVLTPSVLALPHSSNCSSPPVFEGYYHSVADHDGDGYIDDSHAKL